MQNGNINFTIIIVDRIGGRTVGMQLQAASGNDMWDLGGQWVGRCVAGISNIEIV